MKNFVFILLLIIVSCQKKRESLLEPEKKVCTAYANQDCADGTLTIGNTTNATVSFNFSWEDEYIHKVGPGKTITFKTGKVSAVFDSNCNKGSSSSSVWSLSSTEGNWAINVDHCNEKANFEYVDGSTEVAQLVDVTDYSK